jgi:hypothetical protein
VPAPLRLCSDSAPLDTDLALFPPERRLQFARILLHRLFAVTDLLIPLEARLFHAPQVLVGRVVTTLPEVRQFAERVIGCCSPIPWMITTACRGALEDMAGLSALVVGFMDGQFSQANARIVMGFRVPSRLRAAAR